MDQTVTDDILKYYTPYVGRDGRKKLAEIVKDQIDTEAEEITQARVRMEAKAEELETTVANLLDNTSEANREFVDIRLKDLKKQRERLNLRSEELERLKLPQSSIDGTVNDAMEWLSKLEFIFRHGMPQEKLVAIRQCVKGIWINRPAGSLKLAISLMPGSSIPTTAQLALRLHLDANGG